MEASENPQLPIDERPPAASFARSTTASSSSTSRSPTSAPRAWCASEPRPVTRPARTVSDAIEIGARVLEREDAAAEVDYVRAEFERHAAELRERLAQVARGRRRAARRADLRELRRHRGRVGAEQIAALRRHRPDEQRDGAPEAVLGRGRRQPAGRLQGRDRRASTATLDARQQAEGEENRKRIEALTREVVEHEGADEADERVAEAEEAGTRKGRTLRGARRTRRSSGSRRRAETAPPTPAASRRRAAAGRATRWSSSAPPRARRRAGSSSRPRTSSCPRTQAWAELNEGDGGARRRLRRAGRGGRGAGAGRAASRCTSTRATR